ncbi:MAG: hypothetical protein AAB515_03275 [Patescibacteria group bacterium]
MQAKALVSVSDKSGLTTLAATLHQYGIEIISTGGTYRAICDIGIPATKISDFTGAPEIMDGRVKTIHPKVAASILHRRNVSTDTEEMVSAGYGKNSIDFVIINLYPFEKTTEKINVTEEEVIENIDIGGPGSVRAGAKNFDSVCVIVDPADYHRLLAELNANNGKTTLEFRRKMAVKAFAHTCEYDLAIARYLSGGNFDGFTGRKVEDLKYGENPQQKEGAAFFTFGTDDSLAIDQFVLVDGTPKGYVNNTDLDRGLRIAIRIAATLKVNFADKQPCFICLGVKHGNACGVGVSFTDPQEALQRMVQGNPVALFGGFVLTNFDIGAEEAVILRECGIAKGGKPRIFNGIFAPSISSGATALLRRKDGRHRIMVNPALLQLTMDTARQFRCLRGGFQIQPVNPFILDFVNPHPGLLVTGQLTEQQRIDATLAKAICDSSTSNTITVVRDGMLLANGTCRPSRVGAFRTALAEAISNGLTFEGAVLASDSFFPETDGPQEIIAAGIKVVMTTSGSKADERVFELFSEAGVTVIAIPDSIGRGFDSH